MSRPLQKYKYIYGPVPSWRLGSSLGVDPISKDEKICSFDCVYCQIGPTKILTSERSVFVNAKDIADEIASLPNIKIDFITISGRGEPTLAKNLGEIIKEIRKIRKEKIAVITNSSMIHDKEVRRDLLLADRVIAKLDAANQEMLENINRPVRKITFDLIASSLEKFRKDYTGQLDLQVMFIESNKKMADEIKKIATRIKPDEVQLNTPLRKCPVLPIPMEEIDEIERSFDGFKTVSVYRSERKKVASISDADTLKRRGKT